MDAIHNACISIVECKQGAIERCTYMYMYTFTFIAADNSYIVQMCLYYSLSSGTCIMVVFHALRTCLCHVCCMYAIAIVIVETFFCLIGHFDRVMLSCPRQAHFPGYFKVSM